MPLIFTGLSNGHRQYDKWIEDGRPPLRRLPTAKAGDMEFPFMQLVKGPSSAAELILASVFKDMRIPIVLFDWDDEELVTAYFEAHPDEIPDGVKSAARLMARTKTKDSPATASHDPAPNMEEMLAAAKAGGGVGVGTKRSKNAPKAAPPAKIPGDTAYRAKFDSDFAKHKASGHSDARATMYADRSAKKAAQV